MGSRRVPWWRPAALAAVAVPGIFFLTQERGSEVETAVERNPSAREPELQTVGASDRAQLTVRVDAMKPDVARQRAEDRPAPTAEQLGGILEERFAAEAADASWSTAAAQEIARDLRGPGLENSQLGDVRCRATLCRIEVSHSSMEAEQKFIGRIGELEAFRNSEGFVQRAPRSDGSVTTMMFVSRSGYRLPKSPDAATFPLM